VNTEIAKATRRTRAIVRIRRRLRTDTAPSSRGSWWVLLLLALVLAPRTAPAQTAYEGQRIDALRLLGALYREARHEESARLIAEYLEDHPCDAVMTYNLACVQALGGAVDTARRTLDRALALGYPRLESVLAEDDLTALREDGSLDSLVTLHREQRVEQRRAASVTLIEGEWSEFLPLSAELPECAPRAPRARVRFRSDPSGFHVEIDGGESSLDDLEFDLLVGVPRGPETLRTDRVRVFAAKATEPLRLVRWNEHEPTEPEVIGRVVPNGSRAVHTIAWSDLPGLGPPIDPVVAVNARLRPVGAPLATLALVPDPFVGSASVRDRRHGDVAVMPDVPAAPWFRGKVASNTVVGDTASVDLVAQGLAGGHAVLRWTIRHRDPVSGDETQQTVARRDVQLEPDIAFLSASVPLDTTLVGEIRLVGLLDPDDDETRRWSTRILRLDPDWFVDRRARVDSTVRAIERPLVEYRLFRVLESVRRANADDPIDPLIGPVAEVERLLERVERTGTVVPDAGTEPSTFRIAVPAGGRSMAPGWLQRPARGAVDDEAAVVVTTTDGTSGAAATDLLGAGVLATSRARARVLVPVDEQPGDPGHGERVVGGAVDWTRSFHDDQTVVVTTHGVAANPTVRQALVASSGVERIHVLVDAGFDPWPGVDADRLRRALDVAGERPRLWLGAAAGFDVDVLESVTRLREAGVDVRTVELVDVRAIASFLAGDRGAGQRANQ